MNLDINTYKYWQLELENARKAEKDYHDTAKKLVQKVRGEDDSEFNIFWSNIEILKTIGFGNTPIPSVRINNKYSNNDIIRKSALVLERSLLATMAEYDFEEVIKAAILDKEITGRGVARIIYEPTIKTILLNETNNELCQHKFIEKQKVFIKFINWQNILLSPAKDFSSLRWVAFRHRPNRQELIKVFGAIGHKIPLEQQIIDFDANKLKEFDTTQLKRAEVWEIWDKQSKQRIWYAVGFDKLLAIEPDPYQLKDFFPVRFLYGIKTTDSMIPVAEYNIYKKQAQIVDETTKKINKITRELNVKGIYNAVSEEAEKLITTKQDAFIPVLNLSSDSKISEMVQFWPIKEIASTLIYLYKAREQAVNVIYQITGIADIIRGSSNASETATAQQLKGNFAMSRMLPRQQNIQKFVRELLQIKAEIIAEHFTIDNLSVISGFNKKTHLDSITGNIVIGIDAIKKFLQDEIIRGYHIDVQIENSLIFKEDEDKKRRIELVNAITSYIKEMAPLVSSGLLTKEAAKKLLLFTIRGFKPGREIEDMLQIN